MRLEKKSCPGKPVVDWWMGGLYFVADDLTGPHPQVKPYASYFENCTAFFFSGKIHYVDVSEDAVIGIDRSGWPVTFCIISYRLIGDGFTFSSL